jgi:hypothetical protein
VAHTHLALLHTTARPSTVHVRAVHVACIIAVAAQPTVQANQVALTQDLEHQECPRECICLCVYVAHTGPGAPREGGEGAAHICTLAV